MRNNMKYDINYFIKKFESIPDDKWTTGTFVDDMGCMCALGHCGVDDYDAVVTDQSLALQKLVFGISKINDGNVLDYPQPTPKARILAALRDKKEGKI